MTRHRQKKRPARGKTMEQPSIFDLTTDLGIEAPKDDPHMEELIRRSRVQFRTISPPADQEAS